jgi:hypothetical protein
LTKLQLGIVTSLDEFSCLDGRRLYRQVIWGSKDLSRGCSISCKASSGGPECPAMGLVRWRGRCTLRAAQNRFGEDPEGKPVVIRSPSVHYGSTLPRPNTFSNRVHSLTLHHLRDERLFFFEPNSFLFPP